MNEKLRFASWRRSPVYDLVPSEQLADGRLVGRLELTLRDQRSADVAAGAVPFHLASPRDVGALAARAVVRTVPGNLARDAETTKLVHVDFREPDLPWRYTPRKAAGDVLAPWLVLLVGTREELSVAGDVVKIADDAVLADHDLARSHLWAHVQDDTATTHARILSPRRLAPETEYLGVLVPAFDDAGARSWDLGAGRRPAALTALYWWRFWTGEAGDFETLATAILPKKVPGLGRAPLSYRRGALAANTQVLGAITGLEAPVDGPVEASLRLDFQGYLAAIDALSAAEPLARGVVALPVHGRPWVADPATTPWTTSLNEDPRDRGVAGLGSWLGREAQQELVDASVTQLGALGLARHLVSCLAHGLTLARSLWDRRLPDDPLRRVHLLSPIMRRLRALNGSALAAITGPTSPLEPALFSSAARRMLRRGAAQTRHTLDGFVGRRALIEAANVCRPEPGEPAPGSPHVDELARALGLPLTHDPALAGARQNPPRDDLRVDVGDLLSAIRGLPAPGRMLCEAPDLSRVAGLVAGAVDPHAAKPPALGRQQSRIAGIDIADLTAPEAPVSLDFPTWTLLRDRAKEWLLPGVGRLPKDSVLAMQTNPRFIDAYLVGLNAQLLGELHWRGLSVSRRSAPLKMFWGHVNFESGEREAEIKAFVDWSAASDLGAVEHQVLQPGDVTGKRDLVLVFRTDLFRRYPHTLVYLTKPIPNIDSALKATPEFAFSAPNRASRVQLGPIFQGALAPDIVFFAFDVDPATLDQYWLVLDEPPSELRFRSVRDDASALPGTTPIQAGVPAPAPDPHAADFAQRMIDRPTRVAFDGAHLEQLGLGL